LKPNVASLIKPIQGAGLEIRKSRYSPTFHFTAPGSEPYLLASGFRMV